MLVATWYSLPRLGEGYSLSIPVTVYVTARGEVIEGKGIWPQRELEYSLSEAVRGQDSWLARVREDFRRQ